MLLERCWANGSAQGAVVSSLLNMQAADTRDTALHLASFSGFDKIVRLLLQQPGILPELPNAAGLTASQVSGDDSVRQVFVDFSTLAIPVPVKGTKARKGRTVISPSEAMVRIWTL